MAGSGQRSWHPQADYAGDGRGERASQGTRAGCRAGGVQATRELKEEQRDMGLILKSVEIQIGEKLLPTLVKLGSYLVGNGAKAVSGFGTLLDWLSKGILSLVVVWQQMATAAAFGASVVKAALTGNLSEVKRLYEAYAELSDEHAAAMRRLWDDDQKPQPVPKSLRSRKRSSKPTCRSSYPSWKICACRRPRERMPKS